MVNKLRFLLCLITVIFFSQISFFAQNAESEKFYSGEQDDRYFEEYKGPSPDSLGQQNSSSINDSGYYLKNTERGFQFVQRLVWEDSGYVDHYTITIEQFDNRSKKFVQIAENDTTTNSTEVSLLAGTYRYKIAIYNILGQLEIETDWEEFTIETAYEPQIRDISPSAIYMEENPDGSFVVGGRNIRNNAKVELRRDRKKGGGYKPQQIEISSRGNRVNLKFDLNLITPGKYQIVITNPGGLSSISQDITIQYKKPMDFDISAGGACQIVLFDETINKYFENSFFPCAAVKMTFIPSKTPFGYFGVGILANVSIMYKDFPTYKISGTYASAHLNFVYQKPLKERKYFIEAFVGGGLGYLMNYQFEFPNNVKSKQESALAPSVDIGLAGQIYFTNRLFLDLTVPFIVAFPKDMIIGSVTPQVTVGWQF